MEEFEELRDNPDAFMEFLEDYVSVVVGENDFKTNSKYKKYLHLSQYQMRHLPYSQ